MLLNAFCSSLSSAPPPDFGGRGAWIRKPSNFFSFFLGMVVGIKNHFNFFVFFLFFLPSPSFAFSHSHSSTVSLNNRYHPHITGLNSQCYAYGNTLTACANGFCSSASFVGTYSYIRVSGSVQCSGVWNAFISDDSPHMACVVPSPFSGSCSASASAGSSDLSIHLTSPSCNDDSSPSSAYCGINASTFSCTYSTSCVLSDDVSLPPLPDPLALSFPRVQRHWE